jgi:hypothetical protein
MQQGTNPVESPEYAKMMFEISSGKPSSPLCSGIHAAQNGSSARVKV